METSNKLLFNRQSFQEFVKFKPERQSEVLKSTGLLLDTDFEQDTIVNLYFLSGFFVEEIIDKKTRKLQFVLPFKHGFKIQNYVKYRSFFSKENKVVLDFPYCN